MYIQSALLYGKLFRPCPFHGTVDGHRILSYHIAHVIILCGRSNAYTLVYIHILLHMVSCITGRVPTND